MRTAPAPLITRRVVVGKLDAAKVMRLRMNPNRVCRHVIMSDAIEYLRLFSDRAVARKNAGILDQTMLHLLKLYYRINIENDGIKHSNDIVNWVSKVRKDWENDETKKDIEKVWYWYKTDEDIHKKTQKWRRILKAKYKLRDEMDDKIVDKNAKILARLLGMDSLDERSGFLIDEYRIPQSKGDMSKPSHSDKRQGKKKR